MSDNKMIKSKTQHRKHRFNNMDPKIFNMDNKRPIASLLTLKSCLYVAI